MSIDTILIVDDESLIRDLMRDILETSFDVLTASNGHEAIEVINSHNIDLIFNSH